MPIEYLAAPDPGRVTIGCGAIPGRPNKYCRLGADGDEEDAGDSAPAGSPRGHLPFEGREGMLFDR